MDSELVILNLGICYYYQDAIKSPILNFRCQLIGPVSVLYAELSSLDSGSGQNISKAPQSTNLPKHVVRKNMEVKQIYSPLLLCKGCIYLQGHRKAPVRHTAAVGMKQLKHVHDHNVGRKKSSPANEAEG